MYKRQQFQLSVYFSKHAETTRDLHEAARKSDALLSVMHESYNLILSVLRYR